MVISTVGKACLDCISDSARCKMLVLVGTLVGCVDVRLLIFVLCHFFLYHGIENYFLWLCGMGISNAILKDFPSFFYRSGNFEIYQERGL